MVLQTGNSGVTAVMDGHDIKTQSVSFVTENRSRPRVLFVLLAQSCAGAVLHV